jgi:hypothetical protein
MTRCEKCCGMYGTRFGSKQLEPIGRRVGVGPDTEQVVEGDEPYGGHRPVCEGHKAAVGVSHGVVQVKLFCFKVAVSFP